MPYITPLACSLLSPQIQTCYTENLSQRWSNLLTTSSPEMSSRPTLCLDRVSPTSPTISTPRTELRELLLLAQAITAIMPGFSELPTRTTNQHHRPAHLGQSHLPGYHAKLQLAAWSTSHNEAIESMIIFTQLREKGTKGGNQDKAIHR